MTGNLGRKKEDPSTPSLGGPRAQLQVRLRVAAGVEFIQPMMRRAPACD